MRGVYCLGFCLMLVDYSLFGLFYKVFKYIRTTCLFFWQKLFKTYLWRGKLNCVDEDKFAWLDVNRLCFYGGFGICHLLFLLLFFFFEMLLLSWSCYGIFWSLLDPCGLPRWRLIVCTIGVSRQFVPLDLCLGVGRLSFMFWTICAHLFFFYWRWALLFGLVRL